MTTRSKTRLRAGAALVTGIGMMGVATALPAQAATTLTYTCSTDDGAAGPQAITVTLDTNAPDTVGPGETLTVDSVTGTATIEGAGLPPAPDDATVTVPVTASVSTGGTVVGTVGTTLTSESITVGDGGAQIALASHETHSIVVPVEAAGQTFDVLVPESFDATLTGFVDGTSSTTVHCTTDSTSSVIDTVVVTSPEMDEEPDDAEDTAEFHDPAEEAPPVAGAPAEEPVVPQVVQTDGLTPQMLPREDHTVGYALGGLLLAGAGAGTVLVVRRRAQEH